MKVKILPITNSEYICLDSESMGNLENSVRTIDVGKKFEIPELIYLLKKQCISTTDICKYTIVIVRGIGCTHFYESEKLYELINI
jgi:hypothetical protein